MQATDLIQGENGTLEYTAEGVGDARVALFFALVRGIADERIAELFSQCITSKTEGTEATIIADLFVLAFQTRDCRGGKGERDIFYKLLLKLYEQYPTTVMSLLNLFPEYGYFKDFFRLAEISGKDEKYTDLRARITDTIANQLIADEAAADNRASGKKISLCAKYCPREGKHFAEGDNSVLFKELVNKLFPPTNPHKTGKKHYRQLIVKLTKILDVPETKMCGKRFSELDFSKVPSVCTKKFCKAFLNEKVKEPPSAAQEETGNRFPDDEDRVVCRQNLRKATVDQSVKGKQLYPHDIVQTLYDDRRLSTLQKEVFNVQWKDIRQNLLAQLAARLSADGKDAKEGAVNVGKLVPLSDVSGSMSGTPMIVSIALGILVSEVNHPAFRDRVLTFETNPTWVNLKDLGSIAQKVETMRHASWGGSTDVNKAFQRICEVVRTNRLPMSEVPDLIIFSDMQFDQAVGHAAQQTQLQQIKKMFHDVGVEICGEPYPAPKIIFWNLRPDTVGFPAQADSDNVQMLSGFSPSLLKYVLEGEELKVEVVEVKVIDENGEEKVVKVTKKVKPTPYQTLRTALDEARYHPVRLALAASQEGALADYTFEAPLPEPPVASSASAAAMPPVPPVA